MQVLDTGYGLLHKLVRLTGPAIIDQILVSGLNFIIAIYLAKSLGLTGFGQYSIIWALALLCHELQRSWVSSPMMVFSAKTQKPDYFTGVTILQLVVSGALALIAGVFIHYADTIFPRWQISAFALPAGIFIFTKLQQDFKRRYFFVQKKATQALVIDAISAVIIVAGIAFGKTITIPYILYVFAASYAVSSLFWQSWQNATFRQLMETLYLHWHYSKWLLASALTTFVSGDLLLLMGSAALGTKAAGIMKIGQYTMGGMLIIFQAMENIIPNKLSSLVHHSDMAATKNFFYKFVALLLATCLCHGIFITFFLDRLLHWVNHGDYPPVQYTIALCYLVFSAFLCVNFSLNYLLRAFEKTRPIFYASAISAVFNVFCAHTMIQQYDVKGIMACLFVVQIIVFAVYAFYIRRVKTT